MRGGGESYGIRIRQSMYVRQVVRENLLIALRAASQAGDAESVIKVSKYLLKVFNKRNDELIELNTTEWMGKLDKDST